MNVIITQPGNKNFHLFDDLLKQLYPADSVRHQQPENLNPEFLLKCYILIQDGKPKARAALYNNPNLSLNGNRSTCIGNYECVNDKEVAKNLLYYIINECKEAGYHYIIGPMNGSTWDNYRFSNHHQFPNFLLEPYHHLYYNNQFIENGFKIISGYYSAIDKKLNYDHSKILKQEQQLQDLEVKIRCIKLDDIEEELMNLYQFISFAFKSNFLFTPISFETFRAKYIEATNIINPEFVLIAEDNQSNIIGFIFCYDDLFNVNEKNLVIKTIARDESKKWSELGQILYNRIICKAKSKGYDSLIHAFMIEEGSSTKILKKYQGEFYKTYKLYGKPI